MGEQLFVCFSFWNKQRSKVNLSLYGQPVLDSLLCLTIDLAEIQQNTASPSSPLS